MDQPEIRAEYGRNTLGMAVTKYSVVYLGLTEGIFDRLIYAQMFAAALPKFVADPVAFSEWLTRPWAGK